MLVAQLAVMANGVIDTVMAGRLSAVDLAAVGIGASIYVTVFVTVTGVLLALTPTVARLHGAGLAGDLPDGAAACYAKTLCLSGRRPSHASRLSGKNPQRPRL